MIPHQMIIENCMGCQKSVMLHNKIITCSSCNKIAHGKCAKSIFEFSNVENSWICFDCASNESKRYNIFSMSCFDKHDPNSLHHIEDLHELSKILNNCEKYDIKKFNNLSKSINTANKNQFSCLCNNIDGNATNFDTFESEILSQYKNVFSVIAITETNVDAYHKDLYQLSGYTSEYNEKFPGKRKGSGIGLYMQNKFSFNRNNKFSRCTKNIECLFVTLTNTVLPTTVGVVYRPPSGIIKEFFKEWELIIKELPEENVIIMGDFNIDLLQPNNEFESIIYSNMIPVITIATHEKPGCKSSLLDNIFINRTSRLQCAGIMECKVSHHSPVFCYLNYDYSSDEDVNIKYPKYDYCDSNIQKFLKKLNTSFEDQYKSYNEENFVKFTQQFKQYSDECFRVEGQIFKVTRRNFYVNPWVTPGITACIYKKHCHYKAWRKKKNLNYDEEVINAFYDKYKSYRHYLKKIIELAKRNYYGIRFKNVQGDLKKTWSLINELRGKMMRNIKASFNINGELVEDRRQISNEFNTFFASVAKKLNAKLYSSTLSQIEPRRDDFQYFLKNRVNRSMFLSPATVDEIHEIIHNFKNDKASDISIFVLKKCSSLISGKLTKFINSFMDEGYFPHILKIGKITPIYKKDDPQKLGNYRPISILPIFGKIFEKVIYSRLYSFMNCMNVI